MDARPLPTLEMLVKKLKSLLADDLGLTPIDAQYVRVSCCDEFEPFPEFYEDWGTVWHLELPMVQHHWRRADGVWVGSEDARLTMRFKGRTLADVVAAADRFIDELRDQRAAGAKEEA